MKLIFQKEMKTILIIAIEAYRICSGTLLVIFVPGVCGNHACLPHENYTNGTTLYRAIVLVNLVTFFVFLALYGIEIRREFRLHTYLSINKALPTDSESVGKSIEQLRKDKKIKLNTLTQIYKLIGIVTVVSFIINTFLSGYIIITEYGNDKGPVIFATNTLFISGKLYDIYTIVTSEKYVYLSAYEKNHLQYNVANPEKCETEQIVLTTN